jgi:hypothetical protein
MNVYVDNNLILHEILLHIYLINLSIKNVIMLLDFFLPFN